jgi:phospholipase/carboxylesterase
VVLSSRRRRRSPKRRPVTKPTIRTRACCIGEASVRYSFAGAPTAIGFSKSAIMAPALLLIRPSLLAGTILFRPLPPFTHDPPTCLDGKPVLVIDGNKDSRRSTGDGARLIERLICAGATVAHHVLPAGHSITVLDREIARNWLVQLP